MSFPQPSLPFSNEWTMITFQQRCLFNQSTTDLVWVELHGPVVIQKLMKCQKSANSSAARVAIEMRDWNERLKCFQALTSWNSGSEDVIKCSRSSGVCSPNSWHREFSRRLRSSGSGFSRPKKIEIGNLIVRGAEKSKQRCRTGSMSAKSYVHPDVPLLKNARFVCFNAEYIKRLRIQKIVAHAPRL